MKEVRTQHEDLWKPEEKSKSKRKSSKKDIVEGLLQNQTHSKNLVKIFESYEQPDIFKARKKSEHQVKKYQIAYQEQIHRHKITGILVTNQIHTSSLDYTIKKVF